MNIWIKILPCKHFSCLGYWGHIFQNRHMRASKIIFLRLACDGFEKYVPSTPNLKNVCKEVSWYKYSKTLKIKYMLWNCIILCPPNILWITIIFQINLRTIIYNPALVFLILDYLVLSMIQYSRAIILTDPLLFTRYFTICHKIVLFYGPVMHYGFQS